MQNIVFFTGNASTVTFDWKVLAVEINLFSFLQLLCEPAFNSLLCLFSQNFSSWPSFSKIILRWCLCCCRARLDGTCPMFTHLESSCKKLNIRASTDVWAVEREDMVGLNEVNAVWTKQWKYSFQKFLKAHLKS